MTGRHSQGLAPDRRSAWKNADHNCDQQMRMHGTTPQDKDKPNVDPRRRSVLVKALRTSGAGAVALTVLPSAWVKPVVESVVLPAHAQTTGTTTTAAPTTPKPGTPPENLQVSHSVNGDQATITASADNAETYEIKVDGSVVSSSSSYTGTFSEGTHSYSVEVCNNAGCVDKGGSFTIEGEPISTPSINPIGTVTIDDNGGLASTVATITGSDIQSGATYSIISGPSGLSLSGNTLIFKRDVDGNQSTGTTVGVENPDGGSDTESFTLNVNDTA